MLHILFSKSCMYSIVLLAAFITLSCSSDDIDTQHPTIDTSYEYASPVNCQSIIRGQTFVFKARFTDNVQLGSFSINIHHNFNHHSHTTEITACDLDDKKEAVNPLLYIKEFEIEPNQKTYEANIPIAIPADIDTGDYHFTINLTDREGWSTMKGFSIKIVDLQ
jgi:hypothetical protein